MAIAVGRIIVLGGGMLRILAAVSEEEDGYYDNTFDFYDDGRSVAGEPAAVSDGRSLGHILDSSKEETTRSGNDNENKVRSLLFLLPWS